MIDSHHYTTVAEWVAAYRNPQILHEVVMERGFAAVLADLIRVQQSQPIKHPDLDKLIRLYLLESHRLLTLPDNAHAAFVIQQVRDRAHHEGDVELKAACDGWLADKPHLRVAEGWQNPANPHLIRVLQGHSPEVTEAIELTEGRLLSWSSDATLRLWSAMGEELAVLEGHRDWVNGAIELHDGRLLSWGDNGTLRLWSAEGEALATQVSHDRVSDVIVLPNGHILSYEWDQSWRLCELVGEAFATLRVYSGQVVGIAGLRDGRFLSWEKDGAFNLWSAAGELLLLLDKDTDGAMELRDGRLLSWSTMGTLHLWSADGKALATFAGHASYVREVIELADGRLLSWGGDGKACLWSAEGDLLMTLKAESPIRRVIQLQEGRFLSLTWHGIVQLWNADGESLGQLAGHGESGATGIMELSDGRLLSWGKDGLLFIWDALGQNPIRLEGHDRGVKGSIELKNGQLLSWGDDGTLRLWRIDDGALAANQLVGEMPEEALVELLMGAMENSSGKVWWYTDWEWRLVHAGVGRYLHDADIRAITPLADGRCIIGDSLGHLLLIEAVNIPH